MTRLEAVKTFAKAWLPPPLTGLADRLLGGGSTWAGDYPSWSAALAQCPGYDAAPILESVKAAALKVTRGEAAYERDSVLFDAIEYSWPLLAGLLWIAARNGGRLDLLDFGGGLGTTFQQNRYFLADLAEVNWSIVEQPGFVACGKENFETERLRFYDSIEACLAARPSGTLLLSSTLQYLPDPYPFLEAAGPRFRFAILDLTPVHGGERDLLTIQTVPPSIHQARYPCWIFSEARLRAALLRHWDTVADFDSHLGQDLRIGPVRARYRGFILQRRAAP